MSATNANLLWEEMVARDLSDEAGQLACLPKPSPAMPQEAYNITELVIGTSRSANLNVPNLYPVPGGKILRNLIPKALYELGNRRMDGSHKIVYLIGGLPDVTQMHRDPDYPRPTHPKYTYEEVIFPTHLTPTPKLHFPTSITNPKTRS